MTSRITVAKAHALLGAIVDGEWATMWTDRNDPAEVLDLARSCDSDAALQSDPVERHRLTHMAEGLRIVAALLGCTEGASESVLRAIHALSEST